MSDQSHLSAAVILVTYNRAENVRTCLDHVMRQTLPAAEILVVDASPDDTTRVVVAEFPGVRYLRNDLGMGHMATSRAIGVGATDADIVVFIDDDAYAEPDWLEHLVVPYVDPDVGAVGGRADNGIEGEEQEGLESIGLLMEDGTLTGNFAANPHRPVEVAHLLGANMSYRRSALTTIGGIHDHWPGTSLREDADTGLRMTAAGYRVLYVPDAVVFHVGGKYAKGRRFDLRYSFYGARNHVVLLHHALGASDPRTQRYRRAALRSVRDQLSYAGQALRDRDRSPYRKARGFVNGGTRAGSIVASTIAGYLAARGVALGKEHLPHKEVTTEAM